MKNVPNHQPVYNMLMMFHSNHPGKAHGLRLQNLNWLTADRSSPMPNGRDQSKVNASRAEQHVTPARRRAMTCLGAMEAEDEARACRVHLYPPGIKHGKWSF